MFTDKEGCTKGCRIPITPEEQALAEKISKERSNSIAEMMVERSGAKQRIAAKERMAADCGQVLADE
jgi:hypothetical protein